MTLVEGQDQQHHDEAVAAQRANAMRIGLARRQDIKNLRHSLTGKHLTLRDVLLPEPRGTLEKVLVAELLQWLPAMGDVKLARVGRRANDAAVNLLVPCPSMPLSERRWLVYLVEQGLSKPTANRVSAPEREVRLSTAERRVIMLEKRVETVTARNDLLEEQLLNRQFSFSTGESNERLASLADAVETHRRCVVDLAPGSVPAGLWASADETLWETKSRIIDPSWVPGVPGEAAA